MHRQQRAIVCQGWGQRPVGVSRQQAELATAQVSLTSKETVLDTSEASGAGRRTCFTDGSRSRRATSRCEAYGGGHVEAAAAKPGRATPSVAAPQMREFAALAANEDGSVASQHGL